MAPRLHPQSQTHQFHKSLDPDTGGGAYQVVQDQAQLWLKSRYEPLHTAHTGVSTMMLGS